MPDGGPPFSGSSGRNGSSIPDGVRDWIESLPDTSNVPNPVKSWGDLALPGWLTDLKEVSGTLYNFGRNPKTFIVSTLLIWALEQIFGFVEALLASLLLVFQQVASIPGLIGWSLGSAGSTAAAGVFWVIESVGSLLATLVASAGWAAPLLFAVLFVVVWEAGEDILPPVIKTVSPRLWTVLTVLWTPISLGLRLIPGFGGGDG
jgi:hypothetical protein